MTTDKRNLKAVKGEPRTLGDLREQFKSLGRILDRTELSSLPKPKPLHKKRALRGAPFFYAAALGHLGKIGWIGSFAFVACAAVRLARYNVAAPTGMSKKYFKGLSSSVAAGGGAVSMYMLYGMTSGVFFYWGTLLVTVFLSLLMVSNVRFRSFKDLQLRQYPIHVFLSLTLIMALVFTFRELALFGLFIIYLLSGLIEEFGLFRRRRKSDPKVPFLPFGDRQE